MKIIAPLCTTMVTVGVVASGGAAASHLIVPPASQQSVLRAQDRNGCQGNHDGGIVVTPCRVVFDANNPGPVTVHARAGDRRAVILERDNCASRGVATITQQSNHVFTVTPGSTMGSCSAQFTTEGRDENRNQGSQLQVINQL